MKNGYKDGELLARQCLEKNGFTVIDRRFNPDYWQKDIDYTAYRGGYKYEIEVKWDSKINKSGAMFLELITDVQQNRIGWANYTQADFIFYGDAVNKLFYIYSVDDMRQFLEEHKGEYKILTADDYNHLTGEIKKSSNGAIVPIGLFKQYVKTQVIDIEKRLADKEL